MFKERREVEEREKVVRGYLVKERGEKRERRILEREKENEYSNFEKIR